MSAPFAALEQRLNRAVLRHLANATAQHASGQPFDVLLQRELVQPFGAAVDGAGYTCSFEVSVAPTVAEGDRLTIDDVHYRVATGPVPDVSGWVSVTLYAEA